MCFVNIIYNIAIQNTDFGVLQKLSKYFLIYIFFPPFSSPLKKTKKKQGPIFYNFVAKNVLCQYLYTI